MWDNTNQKPGCCQQPRVGGKGVRVRKKKKDAYIHVRSIFGQFRSKTNLCNQAPSKYRRAVYELNDQDFNLHCGQWLVTSESSLCMNVVSLQLDLIFSMSCHVESVTSEKHVAIHCHGQEILRTLCNTAYSTLTATVTWIVHGLPSHPCPSYAPLPPPLKLIRLASRILEGLWITSNQPV